jgi:hypothetical protein
VLIIPRSQWGAAPAESVTYSNASKLDGVVVHWFGIPDSKRDHADCDDQVRGVQRSHQAGEFADIAYNHLVCRHGFVFEGRGFGVQTGANGTSESNRNYAAVCYMAGERDLSGAYTDVGKMALAEIVGEWLRRAEGKAVLPHGAITGSQCPGPTLTQWVHDGGWKVASEAWKKKRLETLRIWILARFSEGWSWERIKRSHNWTEFKRLGGE